MPIPFIFIGAAAAAAALGVGTTVKAAVDQKEAGDVNASADRIIKAATKKINLCRENSRKAIDFLGEVKVSVLDNSMQMFIHEFEKLNHVELESSTDFNELGKLLLDKQEFAQLKQLQTMATSIASGVVSGAVGGAITAFGAYGAAGMLATASTGTAIASLSGAAATNATLAFFGGGSLAAGGLGMAGGTAVLGGLVAGPALAIMGFVLGAKASANLDNAKTNLAKAKEYAEQMNVASALCIGIRRRAAMFYRTLWSFDSIFKPLIYRTSEIINEKGCDYRCFSDAEKSTIAEAMSIASIIKAIINTPILTEKGNLTPESEKIMEDSRLMLTSM